MKLTAWELSQVLDGIEIIMEKRIEQGKGTRNLRKLQAKISAYAELVRIRL